MVKSKNLIKVITLVMICVMVMGLASCGKKAKDDSGDKPVVNDAGKENIDNVDNTDGTTEPPTGWITDAKYPKKDLLKREFLNGGSGTSSSDPEPDPETASAGTYEYYENMKRVEEKYNCTITCLATPWGELNSTFTSSMMAGKPYADYMPLQGEGTVAQAILKNQLTAFEDIRSADDDIFKKGEELIVQVTGFNGKNYLVSQLKEDVSMVQVVVINQDIIKTLDVTNPVDSYNAGNWTFDEFRKICEAATKDTDGDDVIDQFGFSCYPLTVHSSFIIANGGYLLDESAQKAGYSDAKSMRALQFYQDLWKDNLVMKTEEAMAFAWDWEANYSLMGQGKVAMGAMYAYMLDEKSRFSFDYNILPFPKGPDNDTGKYTFTSSLHGGEGGVVIPINANNPSDIFMIYEELSAYNNWETREMVMEKYRDDLGMRMIHEEDVERFLDLLLKQTKYDNKAIISGWPEGEFCFSLIWRYETVAQAVESTAEKVQDEIDKVLNPEKYAAKYPDDEDEEE